MRIEDMQPGYLYDVTVIDGDEGAEATWERMVFMGVAQHPDGLSLEFREPGGLTNFEVAADMISSVTAVAAED